MGHVHSFGLNRGTEHMFLRHGLTALRFPPLDLICRFATLTDLSSSKFNVEKPSEWTPDPAKPLILTVARRI